jgi:hypothetical protein
MPGLFVDRLDQHLSWQRDQLRVEDASKHRFLVLRPGDRYTLCSAGLLTKRATHDQTKPGCISLWEKKSLLRNAGELFSYRGHWDTTASLALANYTRGPSSVGGLGNIMEALVSAAAAAIVSKRILLVENVTGWRESFGWPLTQLQVEGSGFEASLQTALLERDGFQVDSFFTSDDVSAAEPLCARDLREYPASRAWRVYTNQYFLPLLLLNPQHRREVAAMAPEMAEPHRSLIWGPALRYLIRPLPHVMARVEAFHAAHFPPGERVLSISIRCVNMAGVCGGGTIRRAAKCAKQRLLAHNAKHIFVAAMHQKDRDVFARAISDTATAFWYGDAVERQEQSRAQEESRVIDLLLLTRSVEILIPQVSTFAHMARGMADSVPATWHETCMALPPLATEASLQISEAVVASRGIIRHTGRQCPPGWSDQAARQNCLEATTCKRENESVHAARLTDPMTFTLLAKRGLMPERFPWEMRFMG